MICQVMAHDVRTLTPSRVLDGIPAAESDVSAALPVNALRAATVDRLSRISSCGDI